MTYTHLTQEERYQIHNLTRQGIHLSQIAAELGRSSSTISRELRRNASARGYQPALAQDKATQRQTQRRNARQFDPEQWQLVELYLRLSLSPQQVSDRLALEDRLSISTEAIYQYAYANKAQGGDLVGYLRCQNFVESAMPVVESAVGYSRTGSELNIAPQWWIARSA
ncbi:IS30 family transposase [Rhodoferax sp. AJA081-3]|uniref:helix-turn-helix domain-containing protein n=1 Tax=Rhodoferax sp. AJA081-3 TaxID=2752316 RepID=UPI001AE056BD|nr:helix-turn-helix domain-containing protein [Rhodoferax sp. AJA081-3]QTN28584.1 IS30 family transposase [Rhodoferax sp. AJA081-3]QTN29090.1 IS30 family transposase [Rhodoferax sp. AJA081-3]